ncbi:MAG: phosphotransferase [Acidimicrobiales bacterium]
MIEPGHLLASSRAADVFDQGDGTVLRRYRTSRDSTVEAEVMTWLRSVGFPAPAVHHAAGRDLVMEHITGPTMLADIESRPWMAVSHMRTLARIQRALGAISAPSWFRTDDRVPAGRSVVHLDLHPMNVILSQTGPVVIDWTNARRGDGDFDAAMSYVLMATFQTSGTLEHLAQRTLTELFRSFRGRRAIGRNLTAAATFRLDDPNVTPAERLATSRILARRPARQT